MESGVRSRCSTWRGRRSRIPRDLRGLADRVGHVPRVGVDVPGLQGDRERDPRSVHDRASLRRQVDQMHPSIEALRRERSVITNLQNDQAGPHPRQCQHHHAEQREEATGGRAPHSPASTVGVVGCENPGTWRITTSPGAGCTSPRATPTDRSGTARTDGRRRSRGSAARRSSVGSASASDRLR